MPTGAGRIVPFLLASAALHAAVLVAARTERLSIAPASGGEGRTVAVHLVAAGPPGPDPARLQSATRADSATRTSPVEAAARVAATAPDDGAAADRPEPSAAESPATEKSAARDAPRDPAAETPAADSPATPDPDASSTRTAKASAAGQAADPPRRQAAEPSPDPQEDSRERARDAETADRPQARRTASRQPAAGDDGADTATARAERAKRLRADVAAELSKHFSYPRIARSRGWEGRVVLAFRIHPDGRLSDIRVLESSGRAILDKAAVRALELVRQLRAVAREDLRTTVSLTLPVTYRLQSA